MRDGSQHHGRRAKKRSSNSWLDSRSDIEAKSSIATSPRPRTRTRRPPRTPRTAAADIGYFGLQHGIVEEFGEAAFAPKPGQISDPVETPYGFHPIVVTDRQEKPKVDFEQNKPLILNAYAAELQKDLLVSQRKAAKVEIQPMPNDLFVKAPAPTTAPVPCRHRPRTRQPAPAPGASKTAK